jgi:hypothetical protein
MEEKGDQGGRIPLAIQLLWGWQGAMAEQSRQGR